LWIVVIEEFLEACLFAIPRENRRFALGNNSCRNAQIMY
jgi:hypothetical protein